MFKKKKIRLVTDGFRRENYVFRIPVHGPNAITPGTHAQHRIRRLRTQRSRQYGVRAAVHRVPPAETTATTTAPS